MRAGVLVCSLDLILLFLCVDWICSVVVTVDIPNSICDLFLRPQNLFYTTLWPTLSHPSFIYRRNFASLTVGSHTAVLSSRRW